MKIFRLLCLGTVLLFLGGCLIGTRNKPVTFDNSNPLSLAPDIEWAVVTDPYAAFHAASSWSSAVTDHCRRGDILQVTGKEIEETDAGQFLWYCFAKGWLPQSSVGIFSNRLKADAVSQKLKR